MGNLISIQPPISVKNEVGIIDRNHPYFEAKLADMAKDLHLPPILIGLSYTQGSKWSAGPLITYPESKQILFHGREQAQIAGGYAIGFAGGGFSINLPLNHVLHELGNYMLTDDYAGFPAKAKAETERMFGDLMNRKSIYNLRGFDGDKLESPAVCAMVMAHMKTGIVVTIPETGVVWNNIFKDGYSIVNEGPATRMDDSELYTTNPATGWISGIPMKVVVPLTADGKRDILKQFRLWQEANPAKAQEQLFWLDRVDFEDMVERKATSLSPAEIAAVQDVYGNLDGMKDWREGTVLNRTSG